VSLLFFAGFDNFGGGLAGTAGGTADFPASKAGIAGTPYETQIPIVYGGTGIYNSMGVPNQDRFRIGSGAERRNMLVAACGGATATYFAMARIGAGINYTIGQPFQLTIGFNICDFSSANPAGGYFAVRLCRATGTLVNLIEHIGGTSNWRLAGSPLYAFTLGQPTYVEFVIDIPNPNGSSNTFRCQVYVNGELYHTNAALTSLTPQTTELFFELGYDRVQTANRYIGFSDIYLLDGAGEAPFNSRLGPQIVLPYKADSVVASGWTPNGGTDPLTLLTDGSDSTYLTSPIGKASIDVTADLKLAPGSQVNGLAFFTRVGRDSGAPRQLISTAKRVADGTTLGASITASTTAAPGYVNSARYLPKTPAERELLNFSDSGKVSFNISSEQSG
jgi:hypothetical protein